MWWQDVIPKVFLFNLNNLVKTYACMHVTELFTSYKERNGFN